MFTPQTQQALSSNYVHEGGMPGLVTLTAEVYRELVLAARCWDARNSGNSGGGFVLMREQPDGSFKIDPAT